MSRKGFTVIELLIVILTLLSILAIIGKGFSRMYRWYQKAQTQRNLEIIANGLKQYYMTQAYDVDRIQNAVLVVSNNAGVSNINDNTKLSDAADAVNKLSNSYISLSVKDIMFDAFGTPYLLRVSQRLGTGNIQYRNIVVISAGTNKRIESQFDPNTGQFNLAGDDMAAVISGAEIESKKYYETVKKMQKYVQFLEQSFALAFASDASKNVSVDHFINRRRDGSVDQYVDPTNGFANTCLISADCLARPDQLGITLSTNSSIEDESNAWYYSDIANPQNTYILIDDDSNNVRSPDSGATPPYSAHVVTRTPWGTQIILTAIGSTE